MILARMPRTVPSDANPISHSTMSSLAWNELRRCSRRSSIHLTGACNWSANQQVNGSSGKTWHLSPKPPPTSGPITRSRCSGQPRMCAVAVGPEALPQHQGRSAEGSLDVAGAAAHVHHDVVAELLVNERRTRRERSLRVDDRLEGIVLHGD